MSALNWSNKILARILGVELVFLEEIARDTLKHYRPFIKKRQGKKPRVIDNPSKDLKTIQRKILERLLSRGDIGEHLHGSLKGRSARTNAEKHLGKPNVVRIDISDFFPSVDDRKIYEIWLGLGFAAPPARLLTALTTFKNYLPQGAPTSSMLANLVLKHADQDLLAAAQAAGCTYTRYVDDLVFSGDSPQGLVQVAVSALQRSGFRVSRKKLQIMPSRLLQEVTGLGVNAGAGPSVPRYKRDRVRADIHQLARTQPDETFQKKLNSFAGRIKHIESTNPGSAKSLRRLLDKQVADRRE